MERLPPELLAQVCSLCDIRSLKKIRLINTTFAQIAAQYLFEGLCVALIPRYLDRVAEVALHPTLRFHVRTLYFDYDILDEGFAEYDVWKAEISPGAETPAEANAQGQEQISSGQLSQADLDRSHTNFCRLLASQKALFDGRMDLAMLSAALAMLPNLRTIESLERSFCREALPTKPYYSVRGIEYGWVPVLSDVHMGTLLPAPFVDPFVSLRPGLARPLVSLLSGLGLTWRPVHSIDTGEIPWSFWDEDGPPVLQHGEQLLIHDAFRHLKRMHINILVDAFDLKGRLQGLLPAAVTNFIGAAPGLRLLDLEFQWHGLSHAWSRYDRANKEARTFPPAENLFAALTLPSLAIFRLEYCTLTEEILIDFTRRHATTLKEVSISRVILRNKPDRSTSWEGTLKHIAPTLSLDRAQLRRLWSDDIEKVIVAGATDYETYSSRRGAYCEGLADFLRRGGQTDCPNILDFARPAE